MLRKLLSLLLLFSLLPTAVLGADVLYETKTQETVAQGIIYTKWMRMQESGISQIHIVDADLNDSTVSFRPMAAPKGMSYLSNVLNMAKTYGAVAAVNTDFFSWNQTETGRAHAMNLQITDGEVRSSSGIDGGYASLIQTDEGELLMDYFKTEITVTAPTGNSETVYLINQYNPLDRILMYTPAWGELSRGSKNNGVEMVVIDGKVSEFRMNQDPIAIPPNGYILTTSMECNYFLNSNFMIGDEVQLDITLTPDTEKIRHAISGGSMLVQDGERATFTHNITGKHPRTGIGFTEDGHLLLVTVDGRQTGASGMSQEELADLFIELGAVFAMNCDGGGSTTMVTRPEGSFDLALRNAPSGGSMRAVSAAVGLFSNAKIGDLKSIISTASAKRIFVGDAVSIYSVGTDEYQNPCDLSDKELIYKTDNGTLNGNILTPESAGIATVTVSAGRVKSTVTIEVLDTPKQISAYPAFGELDINKSQTFSFVGYDDEGRIATIDPSLVSLKTDSDGLLLSGTKVTLKHHKGGVITASFNGCETEIPITAKGERAAFHLPLKTPTDNLYQEKPQGILFPILTMPQKSSLLVDAISRKILTRKIEEQDYAQILNASTTPWDTQMSQITANKYQKIQKDGILVLTADFSSQSLLKQWKNLFSDLESTRSQNILILLNRNYSFKAKDEEAVFESKLEALAEKGKNIFVLSPDTKTACVHKNGVRYMTVSDFSKLTLKDYSVHKERWCYPEFAINENKLTYRFVPVL